jgi:hypothetical protein
MIWVVRRVLLLSAFTFGSLQALAQESDHRYLYEPVPLAPRQYVHNVGITIGLLPQPVVEQEIPTPSFDYRAKYGLSPDWSAFCSVSSNYVTNVLVLGAQWNNGDKFFSYAPGLGLAGFAGWLDMEGQFSKNSAAAIALVPMVRCGHTFDDFTLSTAIAATYLLHADTKVGSLEDRSLSYSINDVFMTVAFEQPIFDRTYVSMGVTVTYSRTPYQSWVLYNTFDQYQVVPEFFFSFQL